MRKNINKTDDPKNDDIYEMKVEISIQENGKTIKKATFLHGIKNLNYGGFLKRKITKKVTRILNKSSHNQWKIK